MDAYLSNALWLIAVPVVAIVFLGINVFVRASGRRTFHMNLRAFGIEMTINSAPEKLTSPKHEDAP